MMFEAKNSTFLYRIQIQIQQNTGDGKFFFSNTIIWTRFLIGTPGVDLTWLYNSDWQGVKLADFYPPNSHFWYFLGFHGLDAFKY